MVSPPASGWLAVSTKVLATSAQTGYGMSSTSHEWAARSSTVPVLVDADYPARPPLAIDPRLTPGLWQERTRPFHMLFGQPEILAHHAPPIGSLNHAAEAAQVGLWVLTLRTPGAHSPWNGLREQSVSGPVALAAARERWAEPVNPQSDRPPIVPSSGEVNINRAWLRHRIFRGHGADGKCSLCESEARDSLDRARSRW